MAKNVRLQGVSVATLRYPVVIGPWPGPVTSVPGRLLERLIAPDRVGRTSVLNDPLLLWDFLREFGLDLHAGRFDCDAANGATRSRGRASGCAQGGLRRLPARAIGALRTVGRRARTRLSTRVDHGADVALDDRGQLGRDMCCSRNAPGSLNGTGRVRIGGDPRGATRPRALPRRFRLRPWSRCAPEIALDPTSNEFSERDINRRRSNSIE